jgi:trimethylamine--corrinoid protein Co-methyltransferase
MRTMVGQHAAPEARGFQADLAHYYGLPCFGIGGLSGSKSVDQQAALEAALTLLEATLGGSQLIHDVGFMDNGATGSLEQLVICHEIIGWIKHYLAGLQIDAETLALDLVDEIGPGGEFLGTQHTVRHLREDWYPELLDRQGRDAWAAEGGLDLRARARRKVQQTLQAFEPYAIPDEVGQAWDDIVSRVS